MNNVIKYVKELIIKSDELLSKVLRLTPGGTAGTETQVVGTQTDDRVIELPDASGRVVLTDTTDTLTNKSIDADTNTITNLSVSEFAPGVITTDFLGTPTNQQLPTTKSVYDYVVATATAIYDYIDDAIADVYTYVNGAFFRKDGTVPMDNNTSIMWRNAADNDNVSALLFDANDDLYLQTSLYPENVSVELGKLDTSFYRIYGDTFIARYLNNFNDDVMIDIENAQIGSQSIPFNDVFTNSLFSGDVFEMFIGTSSGTQANQLKIVSGATGVSDYTSDILIISNFSGTNDDINSGTINIGTNQTSGTGKSGSVSLFTGIAIPGDTGDITLGTGSTTLGKSGDIGLYAGLSNVNNRGAIILDGSHVSVTDKQIKDVDDPSDLQDAATKNYVDNLVSQINQGLKPKQAARVATTANITLANLQTVDGVVLVAGDRVLVKDQSLPEENGIYIVVDGGAWTRSTDFDEVTPVDEINGAYVGVQEGTVSAGKLFVQTGTVTTVGVSPINFVFFNSAINYVAGDGIDITVDTISAKLDGTTLLKSGAGLKVNNTAFPANFSPDVAGTRDLGNLSVPWNFVYTGNLNVGVVNYRASSSTILQETTFQVTSVLSGASYDGTQIPVGKAVEITISITQLTTLEVRIVKAYLVSKTDAASSSLVITGTQTGPLDVDFTIVDYSPGFISLRITNNEPNSISIKGRRSAFQ